MKTLIAFLLLAGIALAQNLPLPVATQAEATAGTRNDRTMTPLRTAQAIAALGGSSALAFTPMPGTEVDVTLPGNSYAASSDDPLTYSDSEPPEGTSTRLRITSGASPRTIPIPTTWSLARNGNITSLYIPPSSPLEVEIRFLDGRWEIIGDPPELVETIGVFFLDAGSGAITTGTVPGTKTLAAAYRLTGWSISATAASGTTTVRFWAKAYSTAIPTVANVINTSGVSLTTGTSVYSTTLSDFTDTTFAAQDQIRCSVTAVDGTATDLTVTLYGIRL
jgi:hypothetical protein